MQAIRCILVVIDPNQPQELALKRARLIASVSQSRLHLLVCDTKHDHGAHLTALSEQLASEGHQVSTQQAWHESIHQTIINHGYEIASLADGKLHVISAHPSAMLSAADPAFQLKETIEARYRDACKQFQEEFQIPDAQLHVEEGPADALIPRVCHQLKAVVTVIGTVARTGFSGALMGNTAEVVLDTLESDVLVLKPNDIIDHLEDLVRH